MRLRLVTGPCPRTRAERVVSSLKQRSGPAGGDLELVTLWGVLSLVAAAVAFTWIPTHVAAWLDDTPASAAPPQNPFALLIELATGKVAWPGTATVVAVVLVVGVAVVAGVVAALVRPALRRRRRVDAAASHMGRGRAIAATSQRQVRRTAERLGVDRGAAGGVKAAPGLQVARTVAGRHSIWQDWESVSVDIWGPRAGKSSSRAIPAIMDAPGAVVATSNKRDLVDATRDPRSGVGQVWVFDPQGIVEGPACRSESWWWNPLTYVTDETKAQALAEVFSSAVRKPGARTDAYFDAAALDLLASLLLAAAAAGRELVQVYLWLTDPNDDEAARILDDAGYPLSGAAVRGMVNTPDKQRAGVYGTAQQICSFMTNRRAMAWVSPSGVREFRPAAFVRTTDSLYCLSREGRGNAAPIVTALTVAVCEAAEEHAATEPNGRLRVPMVAVLDEAANVCRWPALPDLYSHYGSRGISLLTFLQSWSQGVDAWGREGMRKLWSAANVKVYGGGVSEVEFLDEISRLIGDYQHTDASTSRSKQGRSTSVSHRTDRILDVADLASLERGRVVVFASGSVPVLAQTTPWYDSEHKAVIAASLAAHAVIPAPTSALPSPSDPATGDTPQRISRWLA